MRSKKLLLFSERTYFNMANLILKNNKVLWKCSNSMLALIYETIMEIMNNKKINKGSSIYKFVGKLNQDIYGDGCISLDLDDYLKYKNDILEFAKLFKEAIEQLKEKFQWQDELYNHALKLYQQLVEL